jgi:galactokinase
VTAHPVAAWAPGRVNLIGDHTDYNGGVALPMAIDLGTAVTYQPSSSPEVTVTSDSLRGTAAVPIALGLSTGAVARIEPGWARFAAALIARCRPPLGGALRITSTLPVAAGLSSSAALCVALALVLGADPEPRRMARLCQEAEGAAGSDVGLMDPLVIAGARAGAALLIDFATLGWTPVPLSDGAEVVVVHSGVRRQLTDTPYAVRRAECAAAARALGVALGVSTLGDIPALGDRVLRARARHVVTECARVHAFAEALGSGDLAHAGALMIESHLSMAEDFEGSAEVVDTLVGALSSTPGVYGARMTGGGWGGCVVALSQPGAIDPSAWGARAWKVTAAAGASLRGAPG